MKSQNFDSYLPVVGYEGFYEVSFRGHVRNVRTGQILKPILNHDGYHVVGLFKTGEAKKKLRVHRIVASAWIPNLNNEPCVNHIDHTRTNNVFYNLCWVAQSYERA